MSTNIDHITTETIRKAIGIIDLVHDRAYEIAVKLSRFHQGRERVDLDNPDTVHVWLSDTHCGEVDAECYSFPCEWLWHSDEKVDELVALRKAEERAAKENQAKRMAEATEKAERANYERLKARFEP